MGIFSNIFRKGRVLCEQDLVKPYCHKAKEALLREDLPRAIAYLDRGIRIAPQALDLYLQRAQIKQYGLNNCAEALRDYRYILRELEQRPNDSLACQCRRGMKDMMNAEMHVS